MSGLLQILDLKKEERKMGGDAGGGGVGGGGDVDAQLETCCSLRLESKLFPLRRTVLSFPRSLTQLKHFSLSHTHRVTDFRNLGDVSFCRSCCKKKKILLRFPKPRSAGRAREHQLQQQLQLRGNLLLLALLSTVMQFAVLVDVAVIMFSMLRCFQPGLLSSSLLHRVLCVCVSLRCRADAPLTVCS